MRLIVVTPPAVEPVTLAEAKLHCKVDITDDDALITSLIVAARRVAETKLRQCLVTTQWRADFDGFPSSPGYYNRTIRAMGEGPLWLPQQGGGVIHLPVPPLVSVDLIQWVDTSNTLQTIASTLYTASLGVPGRIQPRFGQVWPIPAPVIDAVQILFTAGYGDNTATPDNVKAAIKLMVAHWYANREAVASGSLGPLEIGVDALLSASDHGSYA